MLFWITAAALTFGACLAILLPLTGRTEPAAPAREHDLEVYRDQLAEIDRDAERGLIAEGEAELARAEIGRRILRLGNSGGRADGGPAGSRLTRIAALAGVCAVPLVSWGIYAAIGSPNLPAQPLAERLARNPAESSLDELVARAERHLAANPDDGQGWEVLAPIYLRTGQLDDAVNAYRNAVRLLGANAAREASLGEALAVQAGGRVGPDARAAFRRALEHEPENAKALYYLGAAEAQDGRAGEAENAWGVLIRTAPADSPWRLAAEQALQQMAAADPSGPAPTRDQMDAAAQMNAEERDAMIEGMVASLDERLRQNPHDKEGWKRLVRSYMVLGDEDQARDALERGVEALGAGTDEAVELEIYAATLQAQESGQ